MDYVKALTEFHEALYDKTKIEHNRLGYGFDAQSYALRMNLIDEEKEELDDAIFEYLDTGKHLDNVRKELCDLLYVVFGTAVVLGLPVDEDFAKVHANNMLKIANGTVRGDGKLVKPVDHPKVVL